jgi:hypothetical protein
VTALAGPEDWRRFLEERLDCPVQVAYGRSCTVPIQTRWRGRDGLVVRMHTMFALAPEEVRDAVARWIANGRRARRACERLDRWIEERLREVPRAERRSTIVIRPHGRHYHLERLADPLWPRFFATDFGANDQKARPAVTWGKAARSRSRHSLRLGSYAQELHLVRLHPVLDQPAVPEWFVRFVLFHEILHAALPPVRGADQRWIHHGPQFRRRERAHPDYARATAWEDANLTRMIRSARTGRPLDALR